MPFSVATVMWTGFTGGPGYSRFRFLGEADAATATTMLNQAHNLFVAIQQYIPDSVDIAADPVVTIHDDSGNLTGEVTADNPPPGFNGGSATNYPGASGAVINWNTSTFVEGRRIKGRTFLVPLAGVNDQQGSLGTAAQTDIQTAATAFVGGANTPIIFSVRENVTSLASIVSATVPDLAAVLRSRRD